MESSLAPISPFLSNIFLLKSSILSLLLVLVLLCLLHSHPLTSREFELHPFSILGVSVLFFKV